MQYHVELTMCVAGNPLKAWRGGTDPDDVWEDKTVPFTDLSEAKDWIRGLPDQTTTHVKLYADDELIFEQDAGADHLDDAAPGVEMPHTIDAGGPPSEDNVVLDAPLAKLPGEK